MQDEIDFGFLEFVDLRLCHGELRLWCAWRLGVIELLRGFLVSLREKAAFPGDKDTASLG